MNNLRAILVVTCFIALLAWSGCYYDKMDEIHPSVGPQTCDTIDTMRYAQHVVPILQSYCYSCHAGASSSSGIQLDSWSTLQAYALNGYLMGDIKHLGGRYHDMPQGGGSLNTCQIAQINKWVNSGAPNN